MWNYPPNTLKSPQSSLSAHFQALLSQLQCGFVQSQSKSGSVRSVPHFTFLQMLLGKWLCKRRGNSEYKPLPQMFSSISLLFFYFQRWTVMSYTSLLCLFYSFCSLWLFLLMASLSLILRLNCFFYKKHIFKWSVH